MNFDQIFEAYYNLYLLESDTPTSTDEEYKVALRLANEAVSRWENYDGTYWKELFTTRVASQDGGAALQANVKVYDTPANFKEAGGYVKATNSTGQVVASYQIIESNQAQFLSDQSSYCFFTGNIGEGYQLNINPAPVTSMTGAIIDYVYYKQANRFATGADITEMPIPYFAVHRMLANRFRGSRNPYYSTALQEAEDALKTMLLMNNSGSWANPWKLPDNSGSIWGV